MKLLAEDNLLKIKNDSFMGMIDQKEIILKYGFSQKTAERAMKKLSIIHTETHIINIIKEYLNGSTAQILAKKYNTSDVNINAILRRRNIERRGTSYVANYHYFDEINTEDKAYFLGFIYADGCLFKNSLQISIHSRDIDLLEKFKIFLKSNHKIYLSKDKETSTICITNRFWKERLNKHGIIPNKTFLVKWPVTIQDKTLLRHFIRGYLDGDGSITKDKNNRYTINFCGTIEFLESLKIFLEENLDIKCNNNLYNRWPKRNTNIRQLTISGKSNAITLLNYLYKDSIVSLDRKYNKYLSLINNKIGA